MGINKYIAESGFCSRRKADEVIIDGSVTINTNIAVIGSEVEGCDIVRIDGVKVTDKKEYEYYILNKPKRVLCSNEDRQ
ncbi:S4 domain-containing protein [Streptobacillus moniliformis]|uniref:S4 domain-containing protein n=1 Tax=Streptobacillus moniliformis TaxID=34105 RepID=UPI0007E4B927|nr:S4 domain-containing protein [Streptobacillus moniliformis]